MDILSKQDCEALLDFMREIAAPGIALPSLDELKDMIACSFWASLEREEGRPVTFAMVFGAGARSGEEDLRITDGPELSSHAIVKLAPAALDEHTGLRLQRGAEGGLRIDALTPLEGDALILEAFAPGQLRFKLGDRTRALLRSGDVTFLASDHADNLLFLVNAVSEYGIEVNAEFVVISQAFECVLESMMRQGHGGTLLWVPADCEWEDGAKIIRFACAEPYRGLRQAVFEVYRATSGDRPIESHGSRADPVRRLLAEQLRSIQDEVDRVGQLTAVDGAVVIDDGMLVRAFGVMLRAESPRGAVRAMVLELGRDNRPDDERLDFRDAPLQILGGSRHRSAAEFILTHPRCLAFVASQDGGLTIFGWQHKSGRLFAIRHAELALL